MKTKELIENIQELKNHCDGTFNAWDILDKSESMLRQQQAEIEALKEKLNEAIDAEKDRRFE